MASLREKIIGHLVILDVAITDEGETASGTMVHSSARRVADDVLSIVRAHDEERGKQREAEAVVDAHVCCEHAGTGDGELLAMAALIPALPMVSKLGSDARERVMDWARRRATDGLPPW